MTDISPITVEPDDSESLIRSTSDAYEMTPACAQDVRLLGRGVAGFAPPVARATAPERDVRGIPNAAAVRYRK